MSDLYNMNDGDSDEPTAPFWMSTFSDMATLLLTFFVLIVAMSEVEVKKFEEALSYFPGRKGMLKDSYAAPTVPSPYDNTEFAAEVERSYEAVLAYIVQEELQDKIQVNLTQDGLHLVITDSVMFESGQATLIEPSRSVLRHVALLVGDKVQSVTVEGHTDDRPIRTATFPSNWELSTHRAASVVRFLLEQNATLDPKRVTATGYGENHPIASNETVAGRAKNRRVEILFSWEPWQSKSIRGLK